MDILEQNRAWHRRLEFYRTVLQRALNELYDALEAGMDPRSPKMEKLRARHDRITQRHDARCTAYCAWAETQVALMRARRRK